MALAPCCLETSSSRTARAVLSRSVLLAALNSTYWLRKYWSMALASFGNATPGKNSFADSGVFAGLAGSPGPRQVDQVDRVFVRQENALKPGLAIERRLVCPGAGAVDQHHRMPARSARNEPLGEAVIAGLDIGGIVGHWHARASEGPRAHALDLDDFFGSGPALRKGVGTRRDGQQECGREQNRMVRHDDPPRVERGSADMFVQSVAVLV